MNSLKHLRFGRPRTVAAPPRGLCSGKMHILKRLSCSIPASTLKR